MYMDDVACACQVLCTCVCFRPNQLEVHQKVKFTEFTDKVVTQQTALSFSEMSTSTS